MMRTFFSKNDYLWGLVWIVLITALFFLPVLLGVQSLFEAYPTYYTDRNVLSPQIKTPWVIDGGTYVRTTVPNALFVVDAVRSGNLPLWTPYDGAGEPYAMINAGMWNPLRFAYFNLFPHLRAFDIWIVLRFIIAAFGLFLFLKELGLSRRSALFGGLAYAFSGYFAVFITYHFLDIDAYVPYVLFLMERYFKNPSLKLVALSGGAIALTILGGHPQVTLIAGLFFGSYFLFRTLTEGGAGAHTLRRVKDGTLMAFIGILLSLPYLANLFAVRSGGFTIYDPNINEGLAAMFGTHGVEHFPWVYLLHFFVSPSTFLEGAIGGHLFDRFVYIIPYASVAALLLVCLSFAMRPKPKVLYFFYAFAALAVLKMAGFPLVNWIGHLPVLDQVGWHKLHAPLSFSLAAVAAFSFDALARGQFHRRRFFTLLSVIPLAFLLVFFFAPDAIRASYMPDFDFLSRRPETIAAFMRALERFPSFVEDAMMRFLLNGSYFVVFLFARTALFFGIALGLILFALKKVRWASTALIAFTVFELWWYMPKVRDGFRYFDPYVKPPYVEFLETRAEEWPTGVAAADYTFPVSLGAFSGVRRLQTTSAIFPKRFWHFLPDTIRRNDNDYFKLTSDDAASTPQRFFDAAGLKYFVAEEEVSLGKAFARIYNEDLAIYENKNAMPRAYAVFEKETVPSAEDARELFYNPNFDYRTSVILEDRDEVQLVPPKGAAPGIAEVEIEEYKPDVITMRAALDRDGILVLTDAYDPGWRVYVDGEESRVYPANALFRGVPLGAGTHTVRFIYRPAWFAPSMIVSGLTLLFVLFVLSKKESKITSSALEGTFAHAR